MADQNITVGADLTNTDKAFAELTKLFEAQEKVFDKFAKSTQNSNTTLNKRFKDLKSVIKSMDTEVRGLALTINNMDKSYQDKLNQVGKILDKQVEYTIKAKVEAQAASRILREEFLKNVDPKSTIFGTLDVGIKRLTQSVLTGKVPFDRLIQSVEELKTTGKTSFEGLNAAATSNLNRIVQVIERAKKSKEDLDKVLARDTQRKTDAGTASTSLAAIRPSNLNPISQESRTIDLAIKRLIDQVLKGKLSITDLQTAITQFSNTGKADLTAFGSSATASLNAIFTTLNKLKIEAQKTAQELSFDRRFKASQAASEAFFQILARQSNAIVKQLGSGPINNIFRDEKFTDLANELKQIILAGAKTNREMNDLATIMRNPQNAAQALGRDLTALEQRLVRVMERAKRLTETVTVKGVDKVKGEENLQKALPQISNIINDLQKRFGKITDAGRFVQLQAILDRIYKSLLNNKIAAENVGAAFQNMMKSTSVFNQGGGFGGGRGGGGNGGPPLLPPGADGEFQRHLLSLAAAWKQAGEEGERSNNRVFLSFSNLFRLFQIQVAHQFFGQLLNEITQSTVAARQFEIKISEIRTLSQENQLSVNQWARGLRELSDSFGLPLLDVTKAAYDAISNQVVKGARTFEFLRTTLEFAKITVSSAADAQNLLSSAIKSFGEENVTAQRAAEILFTTIDLGRVTASEMANTYGRVAQLASTVGVSMEQLSAAITTLTVRGVRYSEAYTLINNVMLKLIKPSEDMQKLFSEWGVSSGEAAIKTFGFVGVMRLLQKELDSGGVARIGELEKDIRAIRGAVGLLRGDAFADFNSSLDQMSKGAEKFSKAGDIIRETAGFKIEQEINKIKNILNEDIGRKFLQQVVNATEPFGGISNVVKELAILISDLLSKVNALIQPFILLGRGISGITGGEGVENLKILISLLVGSAAAVKILDFAQRIYTSTLVQNTIVARLNGATQLTNEQLLRQGIPTVQAKTAATQAQTVATEAQTVAQRSLNFASAVSTVGLTAAITVAIDFIATMQQLTDVIQSQSESYKVLNKASESKRFENERQQSLDRVAKSTGAATQRVNQIIAQQSKVLLKGIDDFKNYNKTNFDPLEQAAEGTFEFLRQQANTLADAVKFVRDEIDSTSKRLTSIAEVSNLKNFEQKFKDTFDISKQNVLLESQIKVMAANIGKAFDQVQFNGNNFFTPAIAENARKAWGDLIGFLDKYISQIQQARQSQEKLVSELVIKSEERQFERQLEGKSPIKQIQALMGRAEQLKTQGVEIFKAGNVEEGRRKLEESERLLERIRQKQVEIGGNKSTRFQVKPADLAQTDQALDALSGTRVELERQRLLQLTDQEKNISDQRVTTAKQLFDYEVNYKKVQEERYRTVIELQQKHNDLMKIQLELDRSATALTTKHTQALAKRNEIQQNLQTSKETVSNIEKDFKQIRDSAPSGFMDAIVNSGLLTNRITETNLRTLIKEFEQQGKKVQDAYNVLFKSTPENLENSKSKVAEELRSAELLEEKITRISSTFNLNSQKKEDELVTSVNNKYLLRKQLLEQIVEQRRALVETEKNVLKTEADVAASNKARNQLSNQFPELEKQIKLMTETQQTVFQDLNKTLQDLNATLRGADKRALGGSASRDRMFTWTNPNETIMNGTASRRFAPQITAMNAGFDPGFSNPTQTSTQVSYGDINVTVQGGGNPREIAREISREIRRQTVRM